MRVGVGVRASGTVNRTGEWPSQAAQDWECGDGVRDGSKQLVVLESPAELRSEQGQEQEQDVSSANRRQTIPNMRHW